MAESYSFSQNAWKRLKKNKGAMIGLAIICFSILVGIFAYFISTDSTPNADRQIVEIQARKPGFKQLFIKVKKEKKISSTGFFSRLLWGSEDKSVFIPINNFR
ncbi:MAG: ABC transporter permease, partial [Ginsengibacter sp.]